MSPRRTTALALSLAVGGLVVVLDTTIAVLALPVLVRELHSPLSTVQWVSTAYVLALVATMPMAAWCGARFGHRRAYVTALAVFALGSAWAGLAHGAPELVAARVVQGLGGGLVNPLGMTLGLSGVASERRGRTAALLGLPVLVGPLVGPVLAGWLVDAVSWRAIFFVTVPPALAAIVLVRRYAAPDGPRASAGRFDPVGSLVLVGGSSLLVLAVSGALAAASVRVAGALLGAGLLALFVARSWRREHPLLDVRLLGTRVFGASAAVLALFSAAYFGSMLLSPTYVQLVRGDSAALAGSLAVPAGLATGLSLQVASRLVDRVPPARIVGAGVALACLGSAAGILVLRADTPYVVVAALACVLGAGSGGVLMPSMAIATRTLTGDLLASGSALLATISQLSSAVGTAAVSATYAAAVAWQVPGLPGGLQGAAGLGATARAVVAPELVTAQRTTQAGVLLVLLAALAVAVLGLPRRARSTDAQAPEAEVAACAGTGRR